MLSVSELNVMLISAVCLLHSLVKDRDRPVLTTLASLSLPTLGECIWTQQNFFLTLTTGVPSRGK